MQTSNKKANTGKRRKAKGERLRKKHTMESINLCFHPLAFSPAPLAGI